MPTGILFYLINIISLELGSVPSMLYTPYNYLFSTEYVRSVLKECGFAVLSSMVMQEGSDLTIHDKKHFYVVRKNG